MVLDCATDDFPGPFVQGGRRMRKRALQDRHSPWIRWKERAAKSLVLIIDGTAFVSVEPSAIARPRKEVGKRRSHVP